MDDKTYADQLLTVMGGMFADPYLRTLAPGELVLRAAAYVAEDALRSIIRAERDGAA